MMAAAPSAGRADAASDTSPGSTPRASPVPASTRAKKPTALVTRKSAAWRRAARSPGTPTLRITSVPNAGPPAPPAGSSTLAPCSARPSTSARRHGTTRSNAAHRARTKPSIDMSSQAAVASTQRGSASASRSRTSSTPGSALIPTPAATAITANSAARRAIARPSTPESVLASGARPAGVLDVIGAECRAAAAARPIRPGRPAGGGAGTRGSREAPQEDVQVAVRRGTPRRRRHDAEHPDHDEHVRGVELRPDRAGRVAGGDDGLEDRARAPAEAVAHAGGQVVMGERLEEAAVAALQGHGRAQEPGHGPLGIGALERLRRARLQVVEDRAHDGEDEVGLGGGVAGQGRPPPPRAGRPPRRP